MKKKISTFLLTTALSLSFMPQVSASDIDPGSGKTLLMIGQIYQTEYEDFIQQSGLTPVGPSVYGTFYRGTFEQGSGSGYLDYIEGNHPGSVVLAAVSFKDNTAGGGYNDVNAGLQGTVDGREDGDIDRYIATFKRYPNTRFLLRIGYEVNTVYIGMNPALYVQAYRRIVDRIRASGVDNVEFVYHPVKNFVDVQPFYPGREYVDWFALSMFNGDVCLNSVNFSRWEQFCRGSVDPNVRQSFEWAQRQGIPLMIAESAAQAPYNESAQDFNRYLERLDRVVKEFDIRALSYINSDWRNFDHDPDFTDSRVQKFPETLQKWTSTFGRGSRYRYLGDSVQNPQPHPLPDPVTPKPVTPDPRPEPTDPSSSTTRHTVEAESTSIYGGGRIYRDAAASGGEGVAYLSRLGAGLSWVADGAANVIHVSYASQASGKISVRVNGDDKGDLRFSSTGGWVGQYRKASMTVDIPAQATVELFYDEGDAALNLDTLELEGRRESTNGATRPSPVTPLPQPTPADNTINRIVEAESGSVFGSARVYQDNRASGAEGVAYISSQGAGVAITNTPAANAIRIRYASALGGAISLRINGEDKGALRFTPTGRWTGQYESVAHRVAIPENATLEIVYEQGDSAINVDSIEFNPR